MTEGQQDAYDDLFSRFPDFGYSTPTLLTTADLGITYTFGLDAAGDPVRPEGVCEIYPNLTAIPDAPMVPGTDFIFEGGLIRFPGGRKRTFSSGPYARFVADPMVAISVSQAPLLFPKKARLLLVYKALEQWAARPGSGSSPTYWESRYTKELNRLYSALSTSYNMQGAQAAGANGEAVWYYSSDLAST
ncbi:MAG: hypothetical protein H0U55_07720 [Rubrobacteraceae bacterium]|nr:hypothetical protein [Rubrobacteraceae bacterium]